MLTGIHTALVTPFTADLDFDAPSMRQQVRHRLEAGCAGVCVLGGTGEPLSMSLDEHCRVIDSVVAETAGRAPVTVGCLLGGQADVVAVARHAETAGADWIMLVPPYFYSVQPHDIERAISAIAEICDLPILLFHTPGRSGVRLDADQLLGLIHRIPAIRAIKDASGDVTLAGMVMNDAPDGFAFMQGLDELLLPTLVMGAAGGIVSIGELLPRTLNALFEQAQSSSIGSARSLQRQLLPLCTWLYAEPNPGPLKFALELAGRSAGPCRAPINRPRDATRDAIRTLLPPLLEIEEAYAT